MWQEFKAFVMRGSVLDLAVAVIIGAAFGQIVTNLVNDVIMPPIGLLVGRINFASLYINLSSTPYPTLAKAQAAGAPVIAYGLFLNAVISFLIVAAVIFLVLRQWGRWSRPKPAPATTRPCPFCQLAIPINASRCPNCTSMVAPETAS